MGTKEQLKLLLWKDFLVRKRHPGILVLIFGWAVAVFLILYIVRESIDPEYIPTCQYKARALPSSGLFPFLQSFICNVDNKCEDVSQYEEVPQYKQAKLTGLANQLQIVFSNETIVDVVKSLPEMIGLLKAVGKGLDSPDLEGIFGRGVKISELFSNPDEVKRKLRESNAVLDDVVLDNIFNASLKFGYVFKSFGSADLGSAVCNPDKLEKYLILKEPKNIVEVSSSLCNINGESIPSLLQNVINHVDISGLLKLIGKVANDFSNYSIYDDIKRLVEVILNLATIKDHVPKKYKLDEWLPNIFPPMKSLNKTHIDTEFVINSLNIIEPHFNDTKEWPVIKNIIIQTMKAMVIFQNSIITSGVVKNKHSNYIPPKNFSDFVDKLQKDLLKLRDLSKNSTVLPPEIMIEITSSALNLFHQFYMNTTQPWEKIANFLDSVKLLTPKSMLHDISSLSFFYNEAILTLTNIVKNYIESEEMIYNTSLKHKDVASTVFSLGPKFVTNMLQCFSNITCTTVLIENKNYISDIFCNHTKLQQVFPNDASAVNYMVLCNENIDGFVNDISKKINLEKINYTIIEAEKRVYPHLNKTFNMQDGNFTAAVINTKELFNYIIDKTKNIESKSVAWETIFPNIVTDEWKRVARDAHENKGLYLLNVQLCYFKEVMENKNLLNTALNASTVIMQGLLMEYKLIPTTLVESVINHLPVIIETMIKTFTNKSQIIPLTNIQNWDHYVCNSNSADLTMETTLNILCQISTYIKIHNTRQWYTAPLNAAIYTVSKRYKYLDNINWDEFISKTQTFYLTMENIFTWKLPEYKWQDYDVFRPKFWVDWFKTLDVETEIRFGLQIATKLADFLERIFFDTNIRDKAKWEQIQSVASTVNNFIIFVNDIIDFSISADNNKSENITNLYPKTYTLSQLTIKGIDYLVSDFTNLANNENAEPDISRLIQWMENPCAENISTVFSNFSSQSLNAVLAIQDAVCNQTKYANEWKFAAVNEKMHNTSNDMGFELTVSMFVKLINKIHKINNSHQTNHLHISDWSDINEHLQITRKGFKLERVLFKIVDKELESSVLRTETLRMLWSKLNKCESNKTHNNCTEFQIDVARYTTKFISAAINELVEKIKSYLRTINEKDSVDPLILMGFTNTSGIYLMYKKLPDLIYVFINSYRSPEFERKIFESKSQDKSVGCSEVLNNLIIPENISVTSDDLKHIARYLCPSFFDWPILQENLFFMPVTNLQNLYLDTPVSKMDISYVSLFNNLLNLREDISNLIKKDQLNVTDLWNKPWLDKMKQTYLEIKKLNFTSNNTLTRYFKYIDNEDDFWVPFIFDVKYGFGGFAMVLKHVNEALQNFTSQNMSMSDLTSHEEVKVLMDLFESYPREVAGIFAYIYFQTVDHHNTHEIFENLCHGNATLTTLEVFVPTWIARDENKILERLCQLNYESMLSIVFPPGELEHIENYEVDVEDLMIQFISTILNFMDNNQTINFSTAILENFNVHDIIQGKYPTVEESRNASIEKAQYLIESFTFSVRYISKIDETLTTTTMMLRLLQGGDWWTTLLNILHNKFWEIILEITERLPYLAIHAAEASISPNLLFDITSKIIYKDPKSLCDDDFMLGRSTNENVFFLIRKFACHIANGGFQKEENASNLTYFKHNASSAEFAVNDTILADHIFQFERSLVDLLEKGWQKFTLPKWLNGTEILKKYQDYEMKNKQPLALLQTVTSSLTQIIDIGSLFYRNETNCVWCPIGTIIVKAFNEHLASTQRYIDFMCNVPNMNFTEVKRALYKDFKWGELKNEITSNETRYTIKDFDKEMHEVVDVIRIELITFYTNKTLRSLPGECLSNITNSPALKNISTYISLVKEIVNVVKSASENVINLTSLSTPVEKFLHLIEKEIEVLQPLEIITNSTDTLVKELKKLNMKNSTISQLMRSDVDINQLEKIKSPEEMEKYFEKRDLFNKLFKFNKPTAALDVYKEVESNNMSNISNAFFYSVDKDNLENNVVQWRNESTRSLEWLANIFESLEDVILHGGDILKFISDIDFSEISSGNFDISGLLKGIVDVLQKKSIEKLFDGLRDFIKHLSPIMRNTVVENDLYALLSGIESLEIFKNLGLLRVKYNISDLVKTWKNADRFLIEEINLNEKVVYNIFNGSIDLFAILSSQEGIGNIKDYICDPNKLLQIVNFEIDQPEKTASEVSKVICNLKTDDLQTSATILLKNMDFLDVLNQVMNTSVSNILTSANMSEEEGKKIVKNVGVGVELLPFLKDVMSNISKDFNTLPSFERLQSGNGSKQALVVSADLLASASKLLCGRPLVQQTSKLYEVIAEAKDFNADNYDLMEQNSLPTQFCKNIYKDIVNMGAGKVIWAYMKPLIRGKIIFTPNNPATRNIMHTANSTFESIAAFEKILFKIVDGVSALNDTDNINHHLQNIQEFMNSSIVRIALQSITGSGISFNNLNLTDMLNNFGDTKKMTSALNFGIDILKCVLMDRFVGVDSEQELEQNAKILMQRNEFIAGVVFLNLEERSKRSIDLPQNISYKIRMDIDSVPSTSRLKYMFWTPGPDADFLDDLRYFRGFIQLQDLIDNAIIKLKSFGDIPTWTTLTQQIPYPCWTRDTFKSALTISQTFQVCFFFGLIAIVAAAVRYVVWEKESGNTMVMNVMGLKYLTHSLSWFVITFIEMLILMMCIMIILKAGRILPMTDTGLLFLFLLDFGFSVIMFCYMVSSIFDSASLAAVGSAIFYLLSFMPYIIIISLETTLSLWLMVIVNLSMSTSFCYGCLYMIRYELQGVGLQWHNAWETPILDDTMNFGITCVFIAFDGILYGIIGYLCSRKAQDIRKIFRFLPWLVSNSYSLVVEPPSYVTFDSELFLGSSISGNNYLDETVCNTNIINHEPLKIGVTIKNLTKIYNTRKKTVKAIEDINIALYTGQVTTLLGHNGAGKTTLIKILTGMLKPTNGQIIINSEIIEYNNNISRYLGVCPQGSVLISKMSAKEHLIFYAKLKTNKPTDEVMPQVLEMIDSMGLGYLSDEPVSHLSEGMKRRLCVAIAFIGKPKLVVLDEPSSGVDPVARRKIWDLIIRHKEGSTVLLTTHYLDEAELLSDRVVVLHKGKVLCSGTPSTLKTTYGSGYKLIITYPQIHKNYEVNDNKVNSLLTTVKEVISNAALADIQGNVVNITVPFNSAEGTLNNYEKLAFTLEQAQLKLGFVIFSMNCATLEHVFLDLCAHADANDGEMLPNNGTVQQIRKSYSSVFSNSVNDLQTIKDDTVLINTGEQLTGFWLNKFLALLKKRAIHYIFDWRVIMCALVLPTLFTAVAMGFSLIRPPNSSEPPLRMSPDLYQPHTTSFISVQTNKLDAFVNDVSKNIFASSALNQNLDLEMYTKSQKQCVCEAGMQKCPKSTRSNYDTLMKLSSVNDTVDWLVETQAEYIERRYGGWSLSEKSDNTSAMVVWYNNKGYHSMPSYLNSMNSAILRTISPGSAITTYSHPLKLSVDQLSKSTITQHVADVGIAMVLMLGFSLVPASGAIYLVQERVNEEKRLQFLCGVGPTLYWAVAFVWDMIVLLCALLLAVVVFKIFGLPVYVERDNLAAVSLLIFLYGWACIPLIHLAEKLFKDASMANMILYCGCVFIGISELTCLLLMDILGTTQFVADFRVLLHKIYLIFPQFVLGDGLVEISKNNIQSEILKRFHMDTYVSPLSWDLMGLHYTSLVIVGIILFLANLLIENQWFKTSKKTSSYPPDTSCLEIVDLSKEYSTVSGKKTAVDNLSLKVPFGQCLGLIGVNGAGKSTTFKMLTTEIRPTSGKVYLQGRDICRKPLCTGEMGYCPQCDALDPKLTVQETLLLYLTLRGIQNQQEIAQKLMAKFEISSYANRKSENLSGGNKRKLCTALSILGKTSLILMDEPTSGMDPYSRTLVALTIQQLTKQNRSVILTSHSVEDCEALCSSVAVMINGKVICQASPQELKERFGSGYIISVRLSKSTDQDQLLELMKKHFNGAELMSRQYCSSRFTVPNEQTRVSEMFNRMSKISEFISLEDYTLVQSSLDQVFINLANKSNELNTPNDEEKSTLPNMYSMDVL